MKKNFFSKKKFKTIFTCLFFFAIATIAQFFSACAQEKIEVASSYARVIFDFEKNEKPIQRLSVFVQMTSNVRRIESVNVTCGDYSWSIENPLIIESENVAWAGYMHLEPPPHLKHFPKGEYSFECIESAGEKTEGFFSVEYDDALLNSKYDVSLFEGKKWIRKIAAYSENDELLSFAEEGKNSKSDEQIFFSVKNSDYIRRVFESAQVFCLAPKVLKDTPDRRKKNGQ